ncbi:T9SS type B sorting domain-containing protein [Sphingobacterium alkalisoli]|uniref:T9SS type B sorting domain-containing protein n=1 Tax=Sphingobacterium alkalisoli TaxID=1874115 RepID=A0A4V5LYZ0_9SPHI|nr:LamG-like jellyroll fold domain-containing protein [Sphingobacterium alkalisoli]TJY68489.1 T9SS type B sorting domain-containing protein [Sphingobacterium alkalisoli]GGH06140.1 hypothetical protein GCM10011418_02690 [Sphingobacterium alkalisoli]
MKRLDLIRGIFILLFFVFSSASQAQEVLSFPGAEGYGRFAEGARGHAAPSVYFVTNLNDSGPGSFRDAVSQPGRFVIFKVSGIIELKDRIAIAANTTIAGHTAPGDGVVLYGRGVSFSGSSHTISRHLRIRAGVNKGAGKNEDASGISNGSNIMLDHMSFTWGLDEVFSINWDNKGLEPDNITIQNSVIGQGLHRHNHSAGGLIQTGGKISILKSLYHSNKTRNPKVKGVNEFVNNVVYNFGNANTTYSDHSISADAYILGGESAGESNVTILNNYFVGGPSTPTGKATPFSRGNGNFNLYQSGNYYDNNQNGSLDGELIEQNSTWYPGIETANFKTAADYLTYPSINPSLSAQDAYQYIIDNVGATLPKRDQVDGFLVTELESKGTQGFYTYRESDLPLANGGVGTFDGAPLLVDTDGDGIPDEWETRLNLDKDDASDALKPSSDPAYAGYLNIEVYINLLAEEAPDDSFVRPVRQVAAVGESFEVEPAYSKVTLTWENAQESNLIIERSVDQENWTVLTTLDPNIATYLDESELIPNTLYYYRFKSVVDEEESVYTNFSYRTPAIPTAPETVKNPQPASDASFVMLTNGALEVKWEGSQNTTSYEVFLGETTDNLMKVSTEQLAQPSFTLSSLVNDKTYFWRVDAINDKGKTTGETWSFTTEKVFEPQLVGHWTFDETEGENATVLLDHSTFANHGVLSHNIEDGVNLRIDEGISGRAINLKDGDKSTYAANIPHADHLFLSNSSFTLGFWMKGSAEDRPEAGASAYLFCKGSISKNPETGATGNRFNLEIKDAQFRFAIDNDALGKDEIYANSADFFTDEWVYVTVVRDVENKLLKFYKNATEVKQGNITKALYGIGEESDLVIGNIGELEFLKQNTVNSAPYGGQMDEVKLFNYALTEAQIKSEYTALLGLMPPHTPTPIAGGVSDRNDAATVTWEGGENATNFKVYLGTSVENLALKEEIAGTELTYTFENLTPGVTYYWKIEAADGTSAETSEVWSFTTNAKMRELIAHYSFDDAEQLGKDYSKYANHAETSGFEAVPYTAEGKLAGAADFATAGDAAQKRLTAASKDHNVLGQESFTISYWMKGAANTYNPSANNAYILHKGAFNKNDGGLGKWFGLQLHHNGNLTFSIDDDVTKKDAGIATATANLFNNEWNHVVATRDVTQKTTSLYVNGERVSHATDVATIDIGDPNRALIIGNSAENRSYRDLLDELKIYNYVLSAEDIQRIGTQFVPVVKTSNVFPTHESTEVDHTDLTLSWEGSEDNYNVYLGESPDDLTLLSAEATSALTFELENDLDGLKTYYWRVDAMRDGEVIEGDVWTFETKAKTTGKELLAYYSFDDPEQIGKDYSRYKNDAAANGFEATPYIAEGKSSGAANFAVAGDAAQKRLTAPAKAHNTLGTQSFSISYWMKGDENTYTVAANNAYMVHKGAFNKNDGGLGKWWGIQLSHNGNINFAIDDDAAKTDNATSIASNNLFNGQWNHIVATRDVEGRTTSVYINGSRVKHVENVNTVDIGDVNRALDIGNSTENKSYRDLMDELKIYNYALSQEDITRLFAENVPTSKAQAVFPLHESVGVDFADVTLEWAGEEDKYNVYFGESPEELELVAENSMLRMFNIGEIQGDNKAYYWRVDAIRDIEVIQGDVWTFQTMPDNRDKPVITEQTFEVREDVLTDSEIGQMEGWVFTGAELGNWRLDSFDDPNGNGVAPVTIDPATGMVYVDDVADFNVGLAEEVTFHVLVNNGDFVSDPTPITLQVLFVNEAPSFEVEENIDICNVSDVMQIPLTNISAGKETNQESALQLTVQTLQNFLFESRPIIDTLENDDVVISFILIDEVQGLVPLDITINDNGGTENGGVNTFTKRILLNINSIPEIQIVANPSLSVLENKEVTLSVSPGLPNGYTYRWYKNDELVGEQPFVVVEASVDAVYRVEVTTPIGCTTEATLALDVIGQDSDLKLEIGNFLTPNNDGVNDFWVIKNLDLYTQNEVSVFDSSGNIIFTKRNYANDWNGVSVAGRLATGVYYYKVVVDGEVFTGSISVVN